MTYSRFLGWGYVFFKTNYIFISKSYFKSLTYCFRDHSLQQLFKLNYYKFKILLALFVAPQKVLEKVLVKPVRFVKHFKQLKSFDISNMKILICFFKKSQVCRTLQIILFCFSLKEITQVKYITGSLFFYSQCFSLCTNCLSFRVSNCCWKRFPFIRVTATGKMGWRQ